MRDATKPHLYRCGASRQRDVDQSLADKANLRLTQGVGVNETRTTAIGVLDEAVTSPGYV